MVWLLSFLFFGVFLFVFGSALYFFPLLFLSVSVWGFCVFPLLSFTFTICPWVLSVHSFFLVYMSDSFFFSSSSFSFSPVLCGLSSLSATARDQASNAKIGDPGSGCRTNRELQPHGTVIGEKSLKGLHFNNKTWPHPKASKLQCQIPHAKQLAKEKHNTTR